MHKRRLVLILVPALALTLGACKKDGQTDNPDDASAQADEAPAEAEATDDAEGEQAHEEGGGHEHKFEGAVAEYHDLLAPLWHAEAGEARIDDTCAAVDDLIAKAQAVGGEATPEAASSEDNWKAKAEGLVATSEALKATCEGERAEFDASFEALHEAFHALIEEIGQGH